MQVLLSRAARGRRAGIEIRIGFRGRKGTATLLLLALLRPPANLWPQDPPPSCPGGPTALVLSGGGAKGLAHVGVIAALDRLDARPDLVVGTSMGAIVGALYAGGMAGRAIDSLVRELPMAALFRTGERRVPHGWGPLTPLVWWEQGERGFQFQGPVVREAETAALLNAVLLGGNLQARGDFDSLAIRFRAVATDLASRETVVLSGGDLARAVRASASVPLLFPPEPIAGRLLVDGGLSANLPVAVARELGAVRVIVSDVTSDPLTADELSSPLAIADQLAGFLSRQPVDPLGPDDILIRHPVRGFRPLDFDQEPLERLLELGRRTADSVLGTAACLPRMPRRFLSPPSRVGMVSGPGLTAGELRTLAAMLDLAEGDPIDTPGLAVRLRRMGEVDAYREVWLGPAGSDPVDFGLSVVREPRRMLALDAVYDNEMGGRLGAGAVDRATLGPSAAGTALVTLGRHVKDLSVGLRRYFGIAGSRVAPAVEARGRILAVRRFDPDGVQLPESDAREVEAFLGIERDFSVAWIVHLGLDARRWWADDGNGSSGGLAFRLERRAVAGPDMELTGVWTGTYRRLHAEIGTLWSIGRVEVEPVAHVGWGERLPLHARFPLGGYEGFPGLHLEERRGDREAMGALATRWPLAGPVSLRVLLAAGRSADGGELLGGDGWLGGMRAGLFADTPVGPVRAEYGLATNGRGAVLVRVGRWF